MTSKKIIIIDDEINICKSINFAMHQAGFESEYYTNSIEATATLQRELPGLIILDIVMPGIDGLELLREVRKISETIPILFISSKDEEFDRILGLEMGADDYLCKPFSMKELVARVKVNFRRAKLLKVKDNTTNKSEVRCGALVINSATYQSSYHNNPLSLTVTEFRILLALAQNAGVVKTREQLLNHAFPSDYYVIDRTIDTHIKRIRKKLHKIDPDSDPIETIIGFGYKLNPN